MKELYVKRLINITFFSLLLCSPFITPAQKNASVTNERLKRAEKTADLFIDRFKRSLDLNVFWNEFRSKKFNCTLIKLDTVTSISDKKKIRIGKARLEKAYLALMNYYYLSNAYTLTTNFPDSEKTEEDIKPKEILKLETTSEYLMTNGKEAKTSAEIDKMTYQLNKVSALYRKSKYRTKVMQVVEIVAFA